jgi:hypothetical protein
LNRPIVSSAGLVALCVVLASCDGQRVAGGTTETENMATARVIEVDSILSPWNHPGFTTTVGTLRLDSTSVDFSRAGPAGGAIAVETMDSVALPFRIVYWDASARLGRIQVRLDPWLQRSGTRFRLRWDRTDSTRSDSARVWSGISDSQRLALTSVLVSDFEQGSLVSLLPQAGVWTTSSGSPATIGDPSVVPADSGRSGHALHISYSAAIQNGYAYVGVSLGGSRNLRSLDSIEFWARGPKTIVTFAFDHQGTTDVKAWTPRYPDSTWKRFSIRPADLDTATGNGGNVGWTGVRDSVTTLCFFVVQGTDLWLDDVRLYGVDRDDLR